MINNQTGYKKKSQQIGCNISTAVHHLRKAVILKLLQELNKDFCFQCGEKIETSKELSLEHKIPYLDSENPKELFYDVNNISFSHFKCNIAAARRTRPLIHGTYAGYKKGCKCTYCTKANARYSKKWMKNKRSNGV